MKRAVFLDRDGTLNVETGYLHRVEDFQWVPGAIEAVHALKQNGWLVVLITNQAGIGRGYYTEQDLAALHDHVEVALAQAGAGLDAVYYCPHHPEAGCRCRKPGTLLYEQAGRDLGIDFATSYAVGDKLADLIPAQRLGCRTILVQTGYGPTELRRARAEGFRIDHVADDLAAAAAWILGRAQTGGQVS